MKSAVVGTGVVGKIHAAILKEQGHAAVFCNAEGVSPFDGKACYSDWRKMLEKEKPDVVHVCTPHCMHAEITVAALDLGASVLCEKPACLSIGEIEAVLKAERGAKGIFGACFQNRYNPSSRFVKKYLRGKRVNGIAGTHVWRRDAAYYASAPWRGKAISKDGVLFNQAIHTLDLMIWLAGEPQNVAAKLSNVSLQDAIETEDAAFLRGSGGAFALFATNAGGKDFPPEIAIEAEGEYIVLLPDAVLIGGKPVPLGRAETSFGKPCYGGGHRALIEDFYDCVQTGRRFEIDGEEAVKSVRAALAAYENSKEETN